MALLAIAPATTIDFEFAGKLGECVRALPHNAGQRRCSARIADRFVLVTWHGTPSALVNSIAKLELAHWTHGSTALEPDNAAEEKWSAAAVEFRETLLRDQLRPAAEDDWFKGSLASISLFKNEVDSGRYKQVPNYIPKLDLPANRLLQDALAQLGAHTLASLPLRRTIVLSNLPTPAQRTIPSATVKLIERLRDAEERLAGSGTFEWKTNSGFKAGWLDPIRSALDIPFGGKVDMFIRRDLDSVSAMLATYGRNGELRTTGMSTFATEGVVADPRSTPQAVDLTEDSAAQLCAFARESNTPPARGAMKTLWDPVAVDPLALAPSTALRVLFHGRNLVAWLDDSALQAALEAWNGTRLDGRRFLAELDRQFTIEESDGTETIAPRDVQVSGLRIVDRPHLRDLISATVTARGDRAKAYFRLALHTAGPVGSNPVYMGYAAALNRMGVEVAPYSTGFWLSKILGALSDTGWSALAAGQPVSLDSPFSSALLWDWCGLGPKTLERGGSDVAVIPDLMLTGTEAFPRGIPDGVQLLATPRTMAALLERADTGTWTVRSLESVAQVIASQISSGAARGAEDTLTGLYQPATVILYDIVVHFPTGQRLTAHFALDAIPTQRWVRYRALPKETRDAIDKLLERREHDGTLAPLTPSPNSSRGPT